MAFHYTREPRTQHLLVGGLLLGAIAVGATDPFAQAWRTLVTEVPDRVLLTGGLMALHTAIFWPVCAAFHLVDRTDRPAAIARYRIQSGARRQPPLGRTLWVLLRNQFLLLPLLLAAFSEALLARGWHADPALPGLGVLALELAGQAVLAVLFFYGAHRFLHRKWWLKRVHRVHHEFRTSTALASEYAHVFEFAVGNFGTLAVGALLLAPSLASIYLFAALALITILVHHSGYALPWAPWSVPHDWHHHRFKEVFGTTGLLDHLFGTDGEFAELEDGDIRR